VSDRIDWAFAPAPPYRRAYWLRFIAVLWCIATLYVLLTLPQSKLPRIKWMTWDKYNHACAFAGLGWLFWRWTGAWNRMPSRWGQVGAVMLFGAIVGTGSELAQGFVPSRIVDPWDILWNMIGTSMAAVIPLLWRGMRAALDLGGVPRDRRQL